MDNVYLIYGDEEFLIDKEIKNIINKFNSSMENVARYNLDESDVREAIEDACTISMFETNKIVICEKCNFLTGENKKEVNHDIDSLIKYINNPFSDSVLIFVVRNPKLDERKKVVKELKKCSKVIECKTIENYNLNNYISNYFKANNYNGVVNIDENNPIYKVENNILYIKKNGKKDQLTRVLYKINSTIEIDPEVTIIGPYAFDAQTELTQIVIPEGVITIMSGAFYYCPNLIKVEIPKTVTNISNNSFANATSKLEEIIIHNKEKSISGAPWGAVKGMKVVNWVGK